MAGIPSDSDSHRSGLAARYASPGVRLSQALARWQAARYAMTAPKIPLACDSTRKSNRPRPPARPGSPASSAPLPIPLASSSLGRTVLPYEGIQLQGDVEKRRSLLRRRVQALDDQQPL